MRPNARLMRLIYHLCSSLYEHRIFIPPPKLPPLHFLSPLSRSHGAGTRVSYLVNNLTLDIWEHSLFWYLHFNCLLLGENYLLLTCVPIHETVSGNPILLGGSDGPNLLKLVCVVASPRPQHRVGEKFGLISDLSSDQPLFKLSWVLLKDGKHEPNISSEWRWMDPLLMGQVGETKLGEGTWQNGIRLWCSPGCGSWLWLLCHCSAGSSHHSAYFPSSHNLHIYVV